MKLTKLQIERALVEHEMLDAVGAHLAFREEFMVHGTPAAWDYMVQGYERMIECKRKLDDVIRRTGEEVQVEWAKKAPS